MVVRNIDCTSAWMRLIESIAKQQQERGDVHETPRQAEQRLQTRVVAPVQILKDEEHASCARNPGQQFD
jgi:hypothetical protein